MSQSADKDKTDITPNEDFSSKEDQEARAFLRERYLRVLSAVTGKTCEMVTVEGETTATAEFQGSNITGDKYLVSNLQGPMFGKYSNCLVRSDDIQVIKFPNVMKVKITEAPSSGIQSTKFSNAMEVKTAEESSTVNKK